MHKKWVSTLVNQSTTPLVDKRARRTTSMALLDRDIDIILGWTRTILFGEGRL